MQSKTFLSLIAFVCGMAIMAMEISASRLLAPFFGTSLFVWTNIIGVVLGSLSLGYYVGGRLSERKPHLNALLSIISISGLLCLFIPWLAHPIAAEALPQLFTPGNSLATHLVFSSLCAVILLFSVPLVLLGMVSPYLIKLYSLHDARIGSSSGTLFAVSTLGSLVGTFLPTLWLIPLLGTRKTIALFAVLLILLGLTGIARWAIRGTVLALLSIQLLAPLPPAHVATQDTILAETESSYQHIQIRANADGVRMLVFNNGLGIQSMYHPDRLVSGLYYTYFALLPRLLPPAPRHKALILGYAGGTAGRELHAYYGDSVEITGVELDPTVTALGKQWFGTNDVPAKIVNADGRAFLEASEEKYDMIIVDTYRNELEIPWTLATQEFWRSVSDHLTETGIVAFNLSAASSTHPLYTGITNTEASVFPYVSSTQINAGTFSNFIIFGSKQPLNLDALSAVSGFDALDAAARKVAHTTNRIPFNTSGPIFTDDRAPIELLTARELISNTQ